MILLKKTNLLPHSAKKFSWMLIAAGICFLYGYFQDIKPNWLNVKVFAIASTYLENRFFEVVQTNLMDEIGVLLILMGIFLLVFSKEQKDFKFDSEIRGKASIIAGQLCLIAWFVAYIFFFGFIILPISIAIFPFFLLLYYLIFRILRTKIQE